MNTYIDQMFGLKGKVALITGATHGIGFGIACALAKAGATICFNGRYKEKNEQALQAYAKEGIQAHGYVCDVTNESEVADMMKRSKPKSARSIFSSTTLGSFKESQCLKWMWPIFAKLSMSI